MSYLKLETPVAFFQINIDGLVQERHNSSAFFLH